MSAQHSVGSWRRILGGLILAVALNQLPWSGWALMLRPDFVLVWALFWVLHQPARVGLGVAFFVGLLADFQHGVVFGQHAIAFVMGAYLLLFLRLRLLQFDPLRQAAQLFPIFLGMQVLILLTGWLAVRPPSGLGILLPAASNTLLWLLIAGVLRLWFGQSMKTKL